MCSRRHNDSITIKQQAPMVTKGIRNEGSLCYAIAVLVQLHAIEEFRELFLLLAFSQQADSKDMTNAPIIHCIQALRQLFIAMKEQNNDEVDLLPFYHAFQSYLADEVDINRLGDSTEFFSNLCRLIKDFEKTITTNSEPRKSLLSLFQGQVSHTLRPVDQPSSEITLEKQQNENFLYLSLDIVSGNLYDALEQYSLPSTPFQLPWRLDSKDTTDSSKPVLLPTTRQTTVVVYPSVLVVHLRRYTIDKAVSSKKKKRAKPRKLHSYFAFPNLLEAPTVDTKDALYELRGTVVHAGRDLLSGHNRSIIHFPLLAFDVKSPANNTTTQDQDSNNIDIEAVDEDNDAMDEDSGSWLLYDDDQVTHYDIADLPGDCFGGLVDEDNNDEDDEEEDDGRFASSVMLFYERVTTSEEDSNEAPISEVADSLKGI